ncbi:MAG: ribosomal protein S18-alanine N-acetyltransferase [Deltaproteobacteria bacterium]|nr:ribosomal protein S18-alanine N-acetyltransferase [Deltaproteobacteria bacterium]
MAAEHESFQLELRPAAVVDLEEIIDLDQRSFTMPWSRRMFLDELSGDDKRLYGVFRLNPDMSPLLLGFICFHHCLDEATLLRIAVHPGKNRKGIASFLIREMMVLLKDKGVKKIFLEVGTSNHAARRLYRSFDFQLIGRRPEYYSGTREDALIMKAML